MMSDEKEGSPLAAGQWGYEVYFRKMKGVNTKGETLPSWAELLNTIQEAWAAVEEAYEKKSAGDPDDPDAGGFSRPW